MASRPPTEMAVPAEFLKGLGSQAGLTVFGVAVAWWVRSYSPAESFLGISVLVFGFLFLHQFAMNQKELVPFVFGLVLAFLVLCMPFLRVLTL